MTYTVQIMPQRMTFTVDAEQTLLDAALNARISFPYRCQVGACGMCLCKLVSGTVRYHLEPLLTEKEKKEGWIFTCQAFAESNLVLTLEE
jgi:ferredoxin